MHELFEQEEKHQQKPLYTPTDSIMTLRMCRVAVVIYGRPQFGCKVSRRGTFVLKIGKILLDEQLLPLHGLLSRNIRIVLTYRHGIGQEQI